MKKYLFLLITFFAVASTINAQLGYGFKAGLNFSNLQGDLEMDDAGNTIESFDNNTGFHVGASLIYKATDLFGVKLDVLFSQKGMTYRYDGQSYFVLQADNRPSLTTTGTRKIELDVSNSYIDLPLMAYIKLGRRLEFSGGVNIAFLVASIGSGELIYEGQTTTGATVSSFTTSLDYNYFQDEVGSESLEDAITRTIGSQIYQIPETLNAYYENDTKNDSYYNVIDFGLNAGVSFFINRGLYFGLRANYGLADVTNNDFDVSLVKLNNGSRIARSDKDTNLSLQASLGFSF